MKNTNSLRFAALLVILLLSAFTLTGCGGGSAGGGSANGSSGSSTRLPQLVIDGAVYTGTNPVIGVANGYFVKQGDHILTPIESSGGLSQKTLDFTPTAISPDGLTVAGQTQSGVPAFTNLANDQTTVLNSRTGDVVRAVSNYGVILVNDKNGLPLLLKGSASAALTSSFTTGKFNSEGNLIGNYTDPNSGQKAIGEFSLDGTMSMVVNSGGLALMDLGKSGAIVSDGPVSYTASLIRNGNGPLFLTNKNALQGQVSSISSDGVLLGGSTVPGGPDLDQSTVKSAAAFSGQSLLLKRQPDLTYTAVNLGASQASKVVAINTTLQTSGGKSVNTYCIEVYNSSGAYTIVLAHLQ